MSGKTTFSVEGMCCPTEEKLVRRSLADLPGVTALEVDVLQREVVVTHDERAKGSISAALHDLGMGAKEKPSAPRAREASQGDRAPQSPWYRAHAALLAAGVAAGFAEVTAWVTNTERSIPVGLAVAVALVAAGRRPLAKAWAALKTGSMTIDVLMTIAVAGAVAIGEWGEAAMVVFLFGVAEALEEASLNRARRAIASLVELAPHTATVSRHGDWLELEVDKVSVGDVVRIRPGERVPLDGVVSAGRSAVDQAPVTGESMPVDKAEGDRVFAGSVNQEGSLDVRVTAASNESTLARIARAIDEARRAKPAVERFIDRFSRVYTPIVVVTALVVAVGGTALLHGGWSVWVYRALILLVVACPCALVIATPVTIVSALTGAARRGILIKGGVHLEIAAKIRVVAVDKTGTITTGRPEVTDVVPLGEASAKGALTLAASLNARSEHPLARAIVAASDGPPLEVSHFRSIPGRGVTGDVENGAAFVGSARLASERAVKTAGLEEVVDRLRAEGKTVSLVGRGDEALAVIAVADAIKPGSKDAIRRLGLMGVRVVMLTGDHGKTAERVASEVGISTVRADLLPEDKLRALEELAAEGPIAMVGDGVNDAPALAKAQLGIAMGKGGSDVAIETADAALMHDDLRGVPDLLHVARRAMRVLKGSMAFAIATKLLFLALAVSGFATLWMAVFADVGTSLIVVLSGLRLLKIKERAS